MQAEHQDTTADGGVADDWASIAPVYDQWSADMVADVPFYVNEAVASGGPVLEIGVGTGRVALAIANAGVEVVGVDLSPSMLQIAARRAAEERLDDRLELVEGDMLDLDLGRVFPLVILPYRVLAHARTPGDLVRTLQRLRDHLPPGGRLVFNLPVPRAQDLAPSDGLRRDGRYALPGGGEAVVWRQAEYEPATQLLRFDLVVDHLGDGGVVTRRVHTDMVVRQNTPGEMEHALARSGFRLSDQWGWFDGRPFDESATEMVWAAVRHDAWKR